MTKSKEEIREQQRQYRETHKEQIREYQKQYRAEHKEEINELRKRKGYCKEYYRAHKAEYMERLKKSQKKINGMKVRRTVEDGVVTIDLRIPLMPTEDESKLRKEIRAAIRPMIKSGMLITVIDQNRGSVMYAEQEDGEIVSTVEAIINDIWAKK